MSATFDSTIEQAEGMTATGIPVPDEAVAELDAGKGPAVVVSVGRPGKAPYTYRTTVASRGGRKLLSFSAANRHASGLAAGDRVRVTIEVDNAPRVLELPDDLITALTDAGSIERFRALSYSHQRAHVEPLLGAKAPETRQRRIDKILEALRPGES